MTSTHARFAGRGVSFAALLAAFLVALGGVGLGGCSSRSRDLEPGTYRGVLELPGGELPFGLDVAREEDGLVLYLVNGEERVRVPDVTVTEGRVEADLPGDGNRLTGQVRGGTLEGEVSLSGADGERSVLRLRAESGQAWRFFEQPSTDNADVSGRWDLSCTGEGGAARTGVAEFVQSFERVTGTIGWADGETAVLAGEVHGEELYLSRFDGGKALLFKARVTDSGDLEGDYWTGGDHQRCRVSVSTGSDQ